MFFRLSGTRVHWTRAWVCLLLYAWGCSDSGAKPASLAALGIDDGASVGEVRSGLAKPDKELSIKLTTGAELKIPVGAVTEEMQVTVKRPPDDEALGLMRKTPLDPVSAPYVFTPHGAAFKKPAEVILPIGKKPSKEANLRVAWLEEESDKEWKVLKKPVVEGSKARFHIDHFSVLMLVEVEEEQPGSTDTCEDCECPAEGIADGVAALTGNAALDGFFEAVVTFEQHARAAQTAIDADLAQIQQTVGVSDDDIASLGDLIASQLAGAFGADLRISASPPRCPLTVRDVAQRLAECLADSGCDVQPAQTAFECIGTCTADPANPECEAAATLQCEFSGPEVACSGVCVGSCTPEVPTACNGVCEGECFGGTDDFGFCLGECLGTCAAASGTEYEGSCDGTCTAVPPTGTCGAQAEAAFCVGGEQLSLECDTVCDGELAPRRSDCAAHDACAAQALATAIYLTECAPPSAFELFVTPRTSSDPAAEQALETMVASLKATIPSLIANVRRGTALAEAAELLQVGSTSAVPASLNALAAAAADPNEAFQLTVCAPAQLQSVSSVVVPVFNDVLAPSIEAAVSFLNAFMQ